MAHDNASSQSANILTVFVYKAGSTSTLLSCVPIRVSGAINCFIFTQCTNERGFADIGPLYNGTYTVTVGRESQTIEIDGKTKHTLTFSVNCCPRDTSHCRPDNCQSPCLGGSTDSCTGSVTIKKYIMNNPHRGLSGAVFSMYDLTRNLIATGTTGPGGLLTFKNVPCGRYVIFEDSSPNGYARDTAPRPVIVSRNNVSAISFPNTPNSTLPAIEDKCCKTCGDVAGTICPPCDCE